MNLTKSYFVGKHIVLILFRAETFRKGFLNLEKNFKNLEAVAFVVNSNGGSAVASNCIANTLKTFCRVNKLKLFTFVDDAALSGGYWLHCIGDETFAYKSSKVGSVGAVLTTIDVGEILKSRGIERKYISSRNENEKEPDLQKYLDLFQDKSDTLAKEHILKLIDEIHNNFKSHVLHHRGAKLTKNKEMRDKIFNAEIFGGEDANNLGLVDYIGDYRSVLKEKFPSTKIKEYTSNSEIIWKEILSDGKSSSLLSKIYNISSKL